METQLTAPRLIDANALKERMNSDFWSNAADLVDALEIIDSAPTVETTDDVMARLPEQSTVRKTVMQFFAYEKKTFGKSAFGKTPLEAVTCLEAALRA